MVSPVSPGDTPDPSAAGGAADRAPDPDALLAAVADSVPALLVDLRKSLYELEPTYAEFLDDRDEEMLGAARMALLGVVTPVLRGVAPVGDRTSLCGDVGVDDLLFGEIGRAQWRLGIPISTLMSAYRAGSRVAWRHLAEALVGAGAPSATLAGAAEAVFCSVDQMSSASAAGFLAEQAQSAAARERCREELVDLLLSGRSDLPALQAAARRASWSLPETAAVVLLGDDPSDRIGRPDPNRGTETSGDWLAVRWVGHRGYVVPAADSPSVRATLRRVLAGRQAVVGWPIAPERLAKSARGAEMALELRASGVLTGDPVFLEDHLDAVLVHRDPALLEALRRQVLAPLDGAAAGSRQALYDTMRSWFRNFGDRRAVAAELSVHPQTVRYRLDRLRELFGDDLDDPDTRLRLILATGWDR